MVAALREAPRRQARRDPADPGLGRGAVRPHPRPAGHPGAAPGAAGPAGGPALATGRAGGVGHRGRADSQAAFDVSVALEFADESALLRRLLSPGPVVEAIEARGEEAVARAVLEAAAPYLTASGAYRLENEWHSLIARA